MTRAEKVAAKKAAWLAAPVAWVEKPLKFIASQVNYYDAEAKAQVISPVFTVAKRHADKGDGAAVQQIARAVLTKVAA